MTNNHPVHHCGASRKWRRLIPLVLLVAGIVSMFPTGMAFADAKPPAVDPPPGRVFLPMVPKAGGLDSRPTLRVNLVHFPDTLDPQKASFINEVAHLEAMYEGLTRWDSNLNTVPGAAETWTYNTSATQLTFTLRSGLTYSDGSLLNAARFAYSIRRNIDPATAGEYAAITDDIQGAPEWRGCGSNPTQCETYRQLVYESVKPLRANGSACSATTPYADTACTRLRLTLSHPAPYFHTVMGMWVVYPAKEENITAGGATWWQLPRLQIGNGPFTSLILDPSARSLFMPNPRYWRGRATYNLEFRFIMDGAEALAAYRNGVIDIIEPTPELMPVIRADPVLSQQLRAYAGSCTFALMFHNQKAPFTDRKVREAFAYAYDRATWVQDVLAGAGLPTLTWISPGFPGYDVQENRWGYDPPRAVQAIADSSYGSVANLPPITATFSDSPRNRWRWTWLIDRFREVLGVEIAFNPVTPDVYAQLVSDPATAPQMYILGWCGDFPDPQNWLSTYWRTGGFADRIGYSNPQLDALLDQADATRDPATRLQLYTQAQRVLVGDVPAAFSWNNLMAFLINPRVTGVRTTPMDMWPGSKEPLGIMIE